MNQFNNPRIADNSGDTKIKRYVHQPLTIEHHGVNAAIKANGKIVLTKVDQKNSTKDLVEWDEIEVPASLIFKLANLLRNTRSIVYVAVSEVKDTAPASDE